ncbi:glutathione peroxidase [Cladochytrium replicatum]|nr:glutathione peroxidase [Cladochytrium replicatum]
MAFYGLKTTTLLGDKILNFADLKGKAVLIVNVASACGFTKQYAPLEELYRKHQPKLEIVGFPCNQFGAQESGSAEEIATFCKSKFDVTFPLSSKIDVNGDDTHPIYTYLKSQQPGDIKWNFEKFLIDTEGNVVGRWGSRTTPEELEPEIAKLLSAKL